MSANWKRNLKLRKLQEIKEVQSNNDMRLKAMVTNLSKITKTMIFS